MSEDFVTSVPFLSLSRLGLTDSQRLEVEAVLKVNEMLRNTIIAMKKGPSTPPSSKHILLCILKEILNHYKATPSTRNVLNEYYAQDKHGTWHALEEQCDWKIEDLWYGRRLFFNTLFKGHSCEVKLHKSLLSDGMPLIVMTFGGECLSISKRKLHLTHMQLFKFQPLVSGVNFSKSSTETALRSLERKETQFFINELILEELSATWLGLVPRAHPQNVLLVDTDQLFNFLDIVRTEPNSKCFLLLSGKAYMHAYIQVNNEKNALTFILPVGSVQY